MIMIPNQQAQKPTSQAVAWESSKTQPGNIHPSPHESSGSIIPIGPCDATSKKSLEDLVSQVEAKEKYISLVVAAAGMSGPKGFPDTPDAVQLKKNPLAGVRGVLQLDI
jgi:hypothetical protein